MNKYLIIVIYSSLLMGCAAKGTSQKLTYPSGKWRAINAVGFMPPVVKPSQPTSSTTTSATKSPDTPVQPLSPAPESLSVANAPDIARDDQSPDTPAVPASMATTSTTDPVGAQ